MASRPRTTENVFLFVPNLIGYSRIILAGVSLTYMSTHPKFCTFTYVISCLLDAVDGMTARALGQTSKFGAVLDMVTDRCTTSCLLCFLSAAYPTYSILFQFLISLDFSSHYIHMYSSLISGSASHKLVTKKQSWILWSYYNNSTTLFLFCAGNELFFVALYLMHSYKTPLQLHLYLPLLLSTLASVSHTITHYLPMLPLVEPTLKHIPSLAINAAEKVTWPMLIALITLPVCAAKQGINCVQFWKASKCLTEIDQEERYALQNKKRK